MASKATKIRAVVSSSDTESYAVQENATGSGSNVPAFLMKLWTLVENPLTDHLISWDSVSVFAASCVHYFMSK